MKEPELGCQVFYIQDALRYWIKEYNPKTSEMKVTINEWEAVVLSYNNTQKVINLIASKGLQPMTVAPVVIKPRQALRARNVAQRLRDE